ncbi:unnamed protein product [Polarella glacialis]|uniref:Uncharacterized protein n=1 Tax=Polarella glacialis TaxID=89957 RepID=A0A813FGA1_POLGL|nr:unnamed protein product [Polarella glacialis]
MFVKLPQTLKQQDADSASSQHSQQSSPKEIPKKKSSLLRVPQRMRSQLPNVPWGKKKGKLTSEGLPAVPSASGARFEFAPREHEGSRKMPPAAHPPVPNTSTQLGEVGDIVRDFVQWRAHGEQELVRLQARIDDMWLEEVMLGCDTELYDRIRQAAADLEAGADPLTARREAEAAATETEAVALQSLRTRLDARDCVQFEGGAAGLESRVRSLRAEAASAVQPYIEQLSDPRRSAAVKQLMESMVGEAQAEYASINAMKTAQAEVVQELQDKGSQREWMTRQLATVVELLEALQLRSDMSPSDVELFFVDTFQHCPPDDALRKRTASCLQVLQLWGSGAAKAMKSLNLGISEAGDRDEDATCQNHQTTEVEKPDDLEVESCSAGISESEVAEVSDSAPADPVARQASQATPRCINRVVLLPGLSLSGVVMARTAASELKMNPSAKQEGDTQCAEETEEKGAYKLVEKECGRIVTQEQMPEAKGPCIVDSPNQPLSLHSPSSSGQVSSSFCLDDNGNVENPVPALEQFLSPLHLVESPKRSPLAQAGSPRCFQQSSGD